MRDASISLLFWVMAPLAAYCSSGKMFLFEGLHAPNGGSYSSPTPSVNSLGRIASRINANHIALRRCFCRGISDTSGSSAGAVFSLGDEI